MKHSKQAPANIGHTNDPKLATNEPAKKHRPGYLEDEKELRLLLFVLTFVNK